MTEALIIEKEKRTFFTSIKMKLGHAEGIIIGTFLIYFFFFGWIANCGIPEVQNNPQEYAPDNILFVYTTFFNFEDNFHPWGLNLPAFLEVIYLIPVAVSLIILLAIGIYQSYRENFVVYGLKNNIWTVPIIILISWIWTSFNAQEWIYITIGRYFTSYHGYVNFAVLLFVYTFAGLIGSWLKTRKQRKEALIKENAMKIFQSVVSDEEEEINFVDKENS
ncbi:MAG: hypothetical protein ACTSRK_03105 [Promethearchaeota archaeon]